VEECLFVDDLTVNVDAARAAGMAALRFDVMDPAGSVAAILKRIGLGPTGASRSQAADAGHSRRPS